MNQASGVFDPLADDEKPLRSGPALLAKPTVAGAAAVPVKRFIRFYKPSEVAAYETPADVPLIGEMHLFKGGIFVVGGAPGVGKSFAISSLAVSGATGAPWFGLKLHRRFKTMILQAENGLVRLSSEYKVHCEHAALDDMVRVSGDVDAFAFEDPAFCAEFKGEIEAFAPDVIVLDPWNRATRDSMEKDFRAAFDAIIACLPAGDARPALVIVAHTRKPRMGERVSGRGLLNLLSGSLVLGSIPRAAFILQAASEDTTRREFVFTCCKNNNGEEGPSTAWRREGVRFVGPLQDFDWEEFKQGGTGGPGKNAKIELHHLEEIFDHGKRWRKKEDAAKALMQLTGAGRSAAYLALDKVKGRFADVLQINPANGEITMESPWPEDGE